mmetsp:Transcript_23461/g.76284  ORF Transcript_23461/g.76284 Transcript_23461/m.76284 type:complete len:159 (-) Transcript_23461:28-504(-)
MLPFHLVSTLNFMDRLQHLTAQLAKKYGSPGESGELHLLGAVFLFIQAHFRSPGDQLISLTFRIDRVGHVGCGINRSEIEDARGSARCSCCSGREGEREIERVFAGKACERAGRSENKESDERRGSAAEGLTAGGGKLQEGGTATTFKPGKGKDEPLG